MKLLKNIFQANQSFDPFLMTSYITQMVTTYLSDFHTSVPCPKKMVQYFNMLPTEPEDGDPPPKLESTITDLVAWQGRIQALSDARSQEFPEQGFSMEMDEVKKMGKVFISADSRDIKELLRLLDHPKQKVRRLMVLLFQVFLKSRSARRRMIDKCGLCAVNGLILVTRLRGLAKGSQAESYLFMLLRELAAFANNRQTQMLLNKSPMKGTILVFFSLML